MTENAYIVGDIESNNYALNDALEIIQNRKNEKLIFLGDIYCPNSSSETIKNIELIMEKLGYKFHNYIDKLENLNDCAKIINIFQKIYLDKRINIYSNSYKFNKEISTYEYLQNEINEFISKNPQNVFLFGNKEIAIINDFRDVKGYNLREIDGEIYSEFRFQYSYKHNSFEVKYKFSCREINVLINYLYNCNHIVYMHKTIMSHIYLNAKRFANLNTKLLINQFICGHNRCFGRFIDKYSKCIDKFSKIYYGIYLLDISHDQEHIIKNYLYLSANEIKYFVLDERAKDVLKSIMFAEETFLKSFDSVLGSNIGSLMFRSDYLDTIKNGNTNK